MFFLGGARHRLALLEKRWGSLKKFHAPHAKYLMGYWGIERQRGREHRHEHKQANTTKSKGPWLLLCGFSRRRVFPPLAVGACTGAVRHFTAAAGRSSALSTAGCPLVYRCGGGGGGAGGRAGRGCAAEQNLELLFPAADNDNDGAGDADDTKSSDIDSSQ
jgi:hypothetical protein